MGVRLDSGDLLQQARRSAWSSGQLQPSESSWSGLLSAERPLQLRGIERRREGGSLMLPPVAMLQWARRGKGSLRGL